MAIRKITCAKCGKDTEIMADVGELCKECWKENRKERRDARIKENLDNAFSYNVKRTVTKTEAAIINEIMEDINSKKQTKRKIYK